MNTFVVGVSFINKRQIGLWKSCGRPLI